MKCCVITYELKVFEQAEKNDAEQSPTGEAGAARMQFFRPAEEFGPEGVTDGSENAVNNRVY